MLYSLYETGRALMAPVHVAARSSRAMAKNMGPLSPFLSLGRGAEAAVELVDDALQKRGKPDWRISATEVEGARTKVSIETVVEKPFCDLIRFRRHTDREDPKLLIVAPLSGHYATLLRGTVRGMLPNHDVYITDWKDASRVPLLDGGFDVDDYIDYLLAFMRTLGPDLHVMAVCQPAPLTIAAVSLLAQWDDPAQPRTMTLMGGPIDTAASPTTPTMLADERSMSWFENRCITMVPPIYPGAFRRVYPGFLQLGAFIAMNADRHLNAHIRMFRHLVEGDGESAEAHRRFYDEYLSVMDVSADYYLQTIRRVFKERWIATGQFVWRGEQVRPDAITRTALLTVEGELDDISAPGQTIAAHDICSSIPADRRHNHLQAGVGHYGIFNGRRWREQIVPEVSRFIREMAD